MSWIVVLMGRTARKPRAIVATRRRSYRIEIPLALGGTAGGNGKLTLHVAVKNGTEGEELKKALELRL